MTHTQRAAFAEAVARNELVAAGLERLEAESRAQRALALHLAKKPPF